MSAGGARCVNCPTVYGFMRLPQNTNEFLTKFWSVFIVPLIALISHKADGLGECTLLRASLPRVSGESNYQYI
jgi:hypothetical protein